jgi:nucleotide-binding universal stress UspA family protein
VPNQGPFANPLDAHLDDVIARAYLTEVAGRLARAGLLVETATSNGSAAAEIVAYAHQHGVDLIVMSSHGQGGLSGWNTSSVVYKVAVRANRAMMIVRAYAPPHDERQIVAYRRLLVPLDGSRRAECVLPTADSLSRAHDAQLVLAHVVRKPEIPDRLWTDEEELSLLEQLAACRRRRAERYLEEVRKHLAVDVEVQLETGDDVPGALQSFAEAGTFDLMMLSAHGYSGSPRRTYGSVTTSLIGYSSMPLLIMQDFEGEQLVPLQAELATQERQGH